MLVRYQFKHAPDLAVLPPEAERNSGLEEASGGDQSREWRPLAAEALERVKELEAEVAELQAELAAV